MKHELSYTLGLILLGLAGIAVSPADADTVAAGPYYATPSWDQQLPASTRFVVLSNWVDANFPSGGAAVLDRETGLVWERSPSTVTGLTWVGAQEHCNGVDIPSFPTNIPGARAGNRLGWRLPTLQELASLVDRRVAPGPTLPAGHPFGTSVQSGIYWSATSAAFPSFAWVVDFGGGNVNSGPKDGGTNLAWCVRGGQGVDPQ
jgi:hypothetical protein